ncbi:hypothetical protein [Endothiovibrio diazotrophicus]
MDRKAILIVLSVVMILLGVGMILPSGETVRKVRALPWEIELLPDGGSRVFNLTLDESTLADAERTLDDEADIQLFVRDGDKPSLEGYFNDVWLSGLKARIVLTLSMDEASLRGLYKGGIRISKSSSGSSQVQLSGEQGALARLAPISSITYLPKATLEEKQLVGLFGEPQRRIDADRNGTLHLLYPSKGLDIALDKKGKAVMQYVAPRDFERLITPLYAASSRDKEGGKE